MLLAGLAICAGMGEFLIIKALEMAHAVVVTPMHHAIIMWATFHGWFIFARLPDFRTWAGTAIIVARGLCIVRREHALARQLHGR